MQKVGRVLSRANETEINNALTALINVLRRAGVVSEGEPMDEKALIEQLKQLTPEEAQLVADTINGMVQGLDETLGITAALQGEQPPVDEDGNPIEEEEVPTDEDGNPIEEDEDAPPTDEEKPPTEEKPEEEIDPTTGQPKKKPPVKSKGWLEQSEANYTPDFPGSDHCASCRWFIASGEYGHSSCHLLATWPAPIVATGHCDRHEPMPTYEPTPMEVVIVAEAAMAEDKPSLKQRVQSLFAKPATPEGNFQVFKGADGKHYWLARHTNVFEDRDKEILSSSAHKRYITRIDMGLVDKPELWMWHQKGTRHGQADYVWEHAGFVFALGHFDETPEAKNAVKFYQKQAGKLELSHGFTYPTWALKDGVYETYNTFEISVLPEGMAANPYTTFEEIQVMALSDKTRAFIEAGLGKEVVERIERAQTAAEKDASTLIAEDKRYKDFADAVSEKDGEIAVNLPRVLKVVAELIDAQGELEALVTKATTDLTAQKDASEKEVATLRQQVADLKAQLDMRPRSAPRAKETEIEGENPLTAALKLVNEKETYVHPVFGTMVKKD